MQLRSPLHQQNVVAYSWNNYLLEGWTIEIVMIIDMFITSHKLDDF
jgi:hypothetical protein